MSNVRRGRVHREKRRESASERASVRDARTPDEQLALLDDRFGPGQGAERERARLSRLAKK